MEEVYQGGQWQLAFYTYSSEIQDRLQQLRIMLVDIHFQD
jgi:hypothetical protein